MAGVQHGGLLCQPQDSPAQIGSLSPTPCTSRLQQPRVGEVGTVHPILQKNKQGPGHMASPDP